MQAYALKPGTFVDVIELLIPELRKRGLFWDDYAVKNGTYRENLYGKKGFSAPPKDHPAAKYQWRAGVAKEDHAIPAEPQNNGLLKEPAETPAKKSVKSSKKRPLEPESGNGLRQTRKSARKSS
jgi:hypothetical protein